MKEWGGTMPKVPGKNTETTDIEYWYCMLDISAVQQYYSGGSLSMPQIHEKPEAT